MGQNGENMEIVAVHTDGRAKKTTCSSEITTLESKRVTRKK
jgi:hypothetical protein